MKYIVCPTCRTDVAPDAQVCPNCKRNFLTHNLIAEQPKKETPLWAWAASTAIVGSLLYSCIGTPSHRGPSSIKDYEALALCQEKIKSVALDRAAAEVPYVEDMGTSSEYYFAWGAQTKHARLRNAAGLDAPASASCIVSKSDRRITQLTINGKTII